jgi:serine/threonine protein kinase
MLAIGTPSYMAPEQARAQLQDARTDVFGVGATLYAVFTGAGPHDGDDECALDRAARQSPSPLLMAAPNLPRALARAIDRAMAHDPSRRWQTAQELRDALNPIARALSRERSASKPALARVKTPRATQTAVTTMRENRETDQPISGSAAVWAGRRPSARTTRDRTA